MASQLGAAEWRESADDLVMQLVADGSIRSAAVEEAFRQTPRHMFIDDVLVSGREGWQPLSRPGDRLRQQDLMQHAYSNRPVVIRAVGRGLVTSSLSAPSTVAAMLEELELREGMRVLEIGTGSGFNAALLARLVGPQGRVRSVEIDPELAAAAKRHLQMGGTPDVTVLTADGTYGDPAGAPYDRIILTASSAVVPGAWLEQLTPEGRVLMVRSGSLVGQLVRIHRVARTWQVEFLRYSYFTPMLSGSGSGLADAGVSAAQRWPIPSRPRSLVEVNDGEFEANQCVDEDFLFLVDLELPGLHRSSMRTRDSGQGPEWRAEVFVKADENDAALFHMTDERYRCVVEARGRGKLAHDLVRVFDMWKSLNRPRLSDYSAALREFSEEQFGGTDAKTFGWEITLRDSRMRWATMVHGSRRS